MRSLRSAIFVLPVNTVEGVFHACYSQHGLMRLDFPGRTPPPSDAGQETTANAHSGISASTVAEWHAKTVRAVQDVLCSRPVQELPPIDLSSATEFQRRVWEALLQIAPGGTECYSAVAQRVGVPNAARAIGAACGANPIPLLIPCHRVVAKGGKLGGFSGGLDWKRRLLRIEHPA